MGAAGSPLASLAPIALLSILLSCGADSSDPPTLTYSLVDNTVNTQSVTLVFGGSAKEHFQFSIEGTAISADIDLGEITPVREETQISYIDEGDYEADLIVYRDNGTPFLADSLAWVYSTEVPPTPIASFSEEATSDARVLLQLAGNKGANTNEVYIEGDVFGGEGFWSDITGTLQVPFDVTDGDGLKTFSVKYRNVFETESEEVTLTIRRKSTGPTGCEAYLSDTTTRSGGMRLETRAIDPFHTYYIVAGDAEDENIMRRFTAEAFSDLILVDNGGVANINVRIFDIASNLCLTKDFVVDFDSSFTYVGYDIEGESQYWSSSEFVTLDLHYPDLPGETIQMHVSGDIVDDENTKEWVRFAETLDIELNPIQGPRNIHVTYRNMVDPTGTETTRQTRQIFLKPYFLTSGSAPNYTIEPPTMQSLASLTIAGCAETYEDAAYASSFPCTANAGTTITVTFTYLDGTEVNASKVL